MSTKEKNMDERIAFGNSLSEKRRESGFSQEELGLKIGKSSNAVSRYENAENTMDVHTFAKTVNALKASPYELLKDLEAPEPDSKIVSLFFQIQRLDKNKKKFALSMVESMLDNLAKEEWYLRLMLIGEDRLAHNLATRDRGRCISFNGISEDFEGMEDELMDVEERVNRQQIAEEMMSVLSDKQKKVVQEFYWNQKTHKQIAKENGTGRTAVTNMLQNALNIIEEKFNEYGELK